MRRGRVLNLSGCKKITDFLKINNTLIVLTAFFILGFSIGIFTLGKSEFLDSFNLNRVVNFVGERTNTPFLKIVFDSFLNALLFMLLIFISGTSIIGAIITPSIICVKGYLYGSFTAQLYSEYSLKGIAFHSIIIIPSAIFLILALILACREAIKFSFVLGKLTFPTTMPINLSFDFKNYCVRNLLLSILVLFSALIDAMISCNLLSKFNLF